MLEKMYDLFGWPFYQRHAFDNLHLKMLWCGYFDGNIKSKRCQEKCEFKYHHTNENIYWALTDDILTEHITRLAREEWERLRE